MGHSEEKTHCEADETKAALPEQVAPQTAAHDLLHELSVLEGQGDWPSSDTPGVPTAAWKVHCGSLPLSICLLRSFEFIIDL